MELEDKYLELFKDEEIRTLKEPEDLRQPTLFKTVRTYTTYGAYEDPI